MIDDSAGLSLNIANIPIKKKKAKIKNDTAPPSQSSLTTKSLFTPTVAPTILPRPIKPKETTPTTNPVVSSPSGILKKGVTTGGTNSIWKKFKKANKPANVKGGFLKKSSVASNLKKKSVTLNDNPEVIQSANDEVSSAVQKNQFKSFSTENNFTRNQSVEPKFKSKKIKFSFDEDKDFSTARADSDLSSESNKVKFSEGKKSKLKFMSDNDDSYQSVTETKKGKVTSLFHNNPEIPVVSHRAVKPVKEAVFSSMSFEEVNLHPFMVKYLKESMGLTKMTTVQEKSIPILLRDKDALIKSQTGSGKTLAFALPILHKLQGITPKITRSDGVLALVIVPTRELALQTYEVFIKLVKSYTWIVPGYLVGGEKKKSEKARLRKGISVLIGTPGRLIDHIQHTKALKLDKVSYLVIDEADRLLDMGYERDVSIILETLNKDQTCLLRPSYMYPDKEKETEDAAPAEKPQNRQTILLSATLTPKVKQLAGLTLKNPVFVDACEESCTKTNVPILSSDLGDEKDAMVLPESLAQTYIITPPKLKLITLVAFILWKSKMSKQKKMLIFVGTQDMVDYYAELLSAIFGTSKESAGDDDLTLFSDAGVELFKLHGNMKQNERTEVFKTFQKSSLGVLLCTDVAARGLDLPEIDWVVQYTGPISVSDYVHRVGRTARGGQSGSSVIFLTPNEIKFIEKLENCQIRLNEEKMETCLSVLPLLNPRRNSVQEEATNVQTIFEKMVDQQKKLYDLACKAYSSWSRFYATYPRNMRDAFSVKDVHQGHHAKSFALRETPREIVNYAREKNLNEKRFPKKRPAKEQNETVQRDYKKTWKESESRNRKRFLDISEFDSGLEPLPQKKKQKK